ncbi:preprotein translocase subunit SecG [Magnetovibrio blakemorei]|uniref:Protein-export membrane protein SecG n=1 Tax=Magnetovibrio blakemorei TaxID=28181 RepID=A0A1E5QCH4_9PROT|nr:preprotein translocase subunit SecG [Magnetovibrio blakemorei]OEJ69385.1 preprotein translocase subunit SecG [Magnetovibrio blakemorei]
MLTVLLVVHVLVTIALIGIVLVQKSEGGALGIGGGGGGGGMGGFMTGRETANLLTRTTAILATLFMTLSLAIAIVTGANKEPTSILDSAPTPVQSAPAPVAPEVPAEPVAPTAPVAE